MIIFNTIKKAEHYVKWAKKTKDFSNDGYDWSQSETFIDKDLVLVRTSGDSCGCGCDMYRYCYVTVVGRIKAWSTKTIRDSKIKKIVEG